MKEEIKYDFNDILIKPNKQGLNSRKQVNPYYYGDMLPIMTAPMDTVVSLENAEIFLKHKITPIIPRNYINIDNFNLPFSDKTWFAYGLVEFDETFLNELEPFNIETKINILIDVANGHMPGIYERVIKTKKMYGDKLVLMVGNVANPETYRLLSDAGADYIRISIGNGNACLTSQQTGVGYPIASLIKECYEISLELKKPAYIVADGGFKTYSDIIKGLALGADFIMLGSILNKALESSAPLYINRIDLSKYEPVNSSLFNSPLSKLNEEVEYIQIMDYQFDLMVEHYKKGILDLYKPFRGMSTKEVQKEWGKNNIRTSEGINKFQKVEYTLEDWIENFIDYLCSAMSYTGDFSLTTFIGHPEIIRISQNAYQRFNK